MNIVSGDTDENVDVRFYVYMLSNVHWFGYKEKTHRLDTLLATAGSENATREDEKWFKINEYLSSDKFSYDVCLSESTNFKDLEVLKSDYFKLNKKKYVDAYQRDIFYRDNVLCEYFVDLLTYFNILNTRNSCLDIDPSFAKNSTINYFKYVLDKIKSKPFTINITDLYIGTMGYILNVRVPDIINESYANIAFSESKEEDEKNIKMYNEYVIKTSYIRENLINDIIDAINKF